MIEFKGTKGKWVSNGNNVLIDEYSRQIQLEYNCGGFGIEREYNALLISKAPEILEMLKECKLQLEYLNEKFTETGTTNSLLSKIESLIKQSTEL